MANDEEILIWKWIGQFCYFLVGKHPWEVLWEASGHMFDWRAESWCTHETSILFLFLMIFSIGVFLNSRLHPMHWIGWPFGWHLLGHGNLLQCKGCKLNWSRNFCLHLFTIWEKWAGNGRGLKLNCCTYILVMFWFFESRKDMWSTMPHQVTKSGTENIGKYLFWHLGRHT